MRHLLHIIISLILPAALLSCVKESDSLQTQGEKFIRVAFKPELDFQIDVKSIELGKTDILCHAYYDSNYQLIKGFPKKQSEIIDGIYFYDLPTSSVLLFFSTDNTEVPLSLSFAVRYLNGYDLGSTYNCAVVCEKSEVTCEKNEFYISTGSPDWFSPMYKFTFDDDYMISPDSKVLRLGNMQRDCKLMFNFTGMPEGETAQTYIDKIHIKVGGMPLDKILTMEDLEEETVEDETLWCKTIYTVMGYDLFGEGFRKMDIVIECTDGKLFVVDQFKYNYIRNEQQRINIDFTPAG